MVGLDKLAQEISSNTIYSYYSVRGLIENYRPYFPDDESLRETLDALLHVPGFNIYSVINILEFIAKHRN